VVAINKIEHPNDIKNDNFGKWVHSGSHPLYFRVQVEHDDYVYVENVLLVLLEKISFYFVIFIVSILLITTSNG